MPCSFLNEIDELCNHFFAGGVNGHKKAYRKRFLDLYFAIVGELKKDDTDILSGYEQTIACVYKNIQDTKKRSECLQLVHKLKELKGSYDDILLFIVKCFSAKKYPSDVTCLVQDTSAEKSQSVSPSYPYVWTINNLTVKPCKLSREKQPNFDYTVEFAPVVSSLFRGQINSDSCFDSQISKKPHHNVLPKLIIKNEPSNVLQQIEMMAKQCNVKRIYSWENRISYADPETRKLVTECLPSCFDALFCGDLLLNCLIRYQQIIPPSVISLRDFLGAVTLVLLGISSHVFLLVNGSFVMHSNVMVTGKLSFHTTETLGTTYCAYGNMFLKLWNSFRSLDSENNCWSHSVLLIMTNFISWYTEQLLSALVTYDGSLFKFTTAIEPVLSRLTCIYELLFDENLIKQNTAVDAMKNMETLNGYGLASFHTGNDINYFIAKQLLVFISRAYVRSLHNWICGIHTSSQSGQFTSLINQSLDSSANEIPKAFKSHLQQAFKYGELYQFLKKCKPDHPYFSSDNYGHLRVGSVASSEATNDEVKIKVMNNADPQILLKVMAAFLDEQKNLKFQNLMNFEYWLDYKISDAGKEEFLMEKYDILLRIISNKIHDAATKENLDDFQTNAYEYFPRKQQIFIDGFFQCRRCMLTLLHESEKDFSKVLYWDKLITCKVDRVGHKEFTLTIPYYDWQKYDLDIRQYPRQFDFSGLVTCLHASSYKPISDINDMDSLITTNFLVKTCNSMEGFISERFQAITKCCAEYVIYSLNFVETLRKLKKYFLLSESSFCRRLCGSINSFLSVYVVKDSPLSYMSLTSFLRALSCTLDSDDFVFSVPFVALNKLYEHKHTFLRILSLKYSVPDAVSKIINTRSLRCYGLMFEFILQINFTIISLDETYLHMKSLARHRNSNLNIILFSIQICRHEMLIFIQNIKNFIQNRTMVSWKNFLARVSRINSLEELISLHENFLSTIIEGWIFNDAKSNVFTRIMNIIDLIMNFHHLSTKVTVSPTGIDYVSIQNTYKQMLFVHLNFRKEVIIFVKALSRFVQIPGNDYFSPLLLLLNFNTFYHPAGDPV